jgi:hypothetical protein
MYLSEIKEKEKKSHQAATSESHGTEKLALSVPFEPLLSLSLSFSPSLKVRIA